MKCEIDIDLGPLADEWEPVAFRVPACGEMFVTQEGNTYVMALSSPSTNAIKHRLILRRRFCFPDWLTFRYLVWDADGTVSGWDELPDNNEREWYNDESGPPLMLFNATTEIAESLGVAFPGGDWKTRIEENPNWKAGA